MKKDKAGQRQAPRVNISKTKLHMVWALAAVTLVLFAVYRFVILLVDDGKIPEIWYTVVMGVYMACGCGLLLAVVILQRGFSNKKLTAEDLSDTMSSAEKTAYIEEDTKRKKRAKILLVPLTAILFVFIFEIVELYYLPIVTGWIRNF